MIRFIINDFLELSLGENGKTYIYVNDEYFEQSMYLMLNVPIVENEKFNSIDSTDEVADLLGWEYEGQQGVEYELYEIDPRTEFWGHCSNLQAWYENDYDTRILHSELAFPLLKKLSDVGDPLARKVFKEEIAKRFESGYPTVIACLLLGQYLNYLNREEKNLIIEQNFTNILANVEKLPEEAYKYNIISGMILSIESPELIKKFYPQIEAHILKLMEIMDNRCDYRGFSYVVKLIEIKELLNVFYFQIEKQFLQFLESIDNKPNKDKYSAFSELIGSIKNTELLNKCYSQIESQLFALLNNTSNLCRCDKGNQSNYECKELHEEDAISYLAGAIKGTKLENGVVFSNWKTSQK